MKRTAGLASSFLVVAILAFHPAAALADVVPARKAKADRDAAKVEDRMTTLGVDAATAKASAERLTPSELRFFAEDSSRVQAVGGLTWYEVAGGFIIGGAVAAAAYLLAVHAEQ
jgi:hypothetical protein